MKARARKRRGFTLIEVLVFLVILGALGAAFFSVRLRQAEARHAEEAAQVEQAKEKAASPPADRPAQREPAK